MAESENIATAAQKGMGGLERPDWRGSMNSLLGNGLVGSAFSKISEALNTTMGRLVDQQAMLYSYSRKMAMGVKGAEALGTQVQNALVTRRLGSLYGLTNETAMSAIYDFQSQIGRNVGFSNENLESYGQLFNIISDKKLLGEAIANFDNMGISLSKAADHTSKMWNEATSAGLSFEKLSSTVYSNIKVASSYGFKKGVDDLIEMSKRAQTIKMDIKDALKFADSLTADGFKSVSSISARLQVLGGNFSRMSNPLTLMYKSMYDVSGLQEDMANAIRGLGHFDEEKGLMQYSAVEREKLKAYAQATGQDYQKVIDTQNQQAKRDRLEQYIEGSGGKIDPKLKELLLNVGKIENGQYGATVNGTFMTIDQIKNNNEAQRALLLQQSEEQNVASIAENVNSIADYLSKMSADVENKTLNLETNIFGGLTGGKAIDTVTKGLKEARDTLSTYITGMKKADEVVSSLAVAFKSMASVLMPKKAEGGLLEGNSHDDGGIAAVSKATGKQIAEVEGNEFVVRKESAIPNISLLTAINESKGPFMPKFEDGGTLPSGGAEGGGDFTTAVKTATAALNMFSIFAGKKSISAPINTWDKFAQKERPIDTRDNYVERTEQNIYQIQNGSDSSQNILGISERIDKSATSFLEKAELLSGNLDNKVSEISGKIDALITALGGLSLDINFGNLDAKVHTDTNMINISKLIEKMLEDPSLKKELTKKIAASLGGRNNTAINA